ncbi:MAG TPA: HAMP domain-containing sensor histidine kinase [Vicinamibacterales bacterium]|nr:HAMP domain-containing sensor histidine kinase [Vicinamibacterales bacterium]
MRFGTSRFHDRRSPVSAVTILVALVMLLLPALAWMQYQWLGQLSTAERERMQRTLRTAAAQFATEFDTELSRTLVGLQIDGQMLRDQSFAGYAQRYSQWTSSAAEPRLVRDVWLVDTLPGTALPDLAGLNRPAAIPVDRLRLRRWNAQALTFEAAPWPADLLQFRDSLATRFIGFQMEVGRRQGERGTTHREREIRDASMTVTIGDDTTLVSPVTLFELPEERPGPPKISVLGYTLVRLDPAVMRDTILAALASRHFHGDDTEAAYRVAVVDRLAPSKVIWESAPGVATAIAATPDVTQSFMGPRPEQMFVFAKNLRSDTPPPPPPPPPGTANGQRETERTTRTDNIVVSMIERDELRGTGTGPRGRVITRAGQFTAMDGRWLLMAKHRAGSLEAAVAQVRLRNLGISSGILLLLAMAVGLIVVSARRAQLLARQQMEFVAAVSHELRTPVSVIGAAAGNLADGVVGDPRRVRKYGETIQGEARRLGETVERVLQLAGIAAGKAAAARTLISPSELVQDSLGACRAEINQAGVTVEVSIDESLPNVVGDVAALRSALQNLISNAVKYGGNARWVRVSARRDRDSGMRDRVVFAVEDRGIGIDPEDRKHIFEPFYRGREAVSQQIQGSGLGLNLVARIAEAHGGSVAVSSEPGKGSTFTLSLTAVHDQPAAAASFNPAASPVGD